VSRGQTPSKISRMSIWWHTQTKNFGKRGKLGSGVSVTSTLTQNGKSLVRGEMLDRLLLGLHPACQPCPPRAPLFWGLVYWHRVCIRCMPRANDAVRHDLCCWHGACIAIPKTQARTACPFCALKGTGGGSWGGSTCFPERARIRDVQHLCGFAGMTHFDAQCWHDLSKADHDPCQCQ